MQRRIANDGDTIKLATGKLGVVKAYKHLGCELVATGNLRKEFCRRGRRAAQAVGAMGVFLRNRAFSRAARLIVLQAVVDGILTSAAGWWSDLQGHHLKLLSTARTRAIRMVAGIRPGPGGPTDREVMKGLQVIPLRLR